MFDSSAAAIAVLNDDNQSEQERENAIGFLKNNPDDAGIRALVAVLHDADAGVRWSASVALAELGNASLRPLLAELTSTRNDVNLRQGALHAFHYNADASVREHTAELQRSLKGPGAASASMDAAVALMRQLL
jgi:HEAT repeat protein